MLLPLPTYLKAGRDIESLPRGEGTIINSGPLALRKVGAGQGWLTRLAVGGWYKCTLHNVVRVVPVFRLLCQVYSAAGILMFGRQVQGDHFRRMGSVMHAADCNACQQ